MDGRQPDPLAKALGVLRCDDFKVERYDLGFETLGSPKVSFAFP